MVSTEASERQPVGVSTQQLCIDGHSWTASPARTLAPLEPGLLAISNKEKHIDFAAWRRWCPSRWKNSGGHACTGIPDPQRERPGKT